MQLTSYIKHFWKRDKLLIKVVVISCFLIDTVCTIAVFSWALMSTVVHWGDKAYLILQYWPTPTYVVCTTVVGAIVQSFLISRYFILSSQRIITIILGVFALTAFAGGLSVAFILIFFMTYADRDRLTVTSILWLGSTSIADILIMVFLVLTLMRAASMAPIRSTRALTSRLIMVAIQSGTVTTVLALLTLSIFLAKPRTNDSAYLSLSIGRVYTLTMLFNLNLRRNLRNRCHSCGMNTLGGVISAAPGNRSLQVDLVPAEPHGSSSTPLHPSSRLRFDKNELAPTEDSEGKSYEESRACHTSNGLGTA